MSDQVLEMGKRVTEVADSLDEIGKEMEKGRLLEAEACTYIKDIQRNLTEIIDSLEGEDSQLTYGDLATKLQIQFDHTQKEVQTATEHMERCSMHVVPGKETLDRVNTIIEEFRETTQRIRNLLNLNFGG